MNKVIIKDMEIHERPYEKFQQMGIEALTDAELLAVIIKTGTKGESVVTLAEKVLKSATNTKGILSLNKLNGTQLQKIKGIGKVKSMQIQCIAELSKRLSKATAKKQLCFNCPSTIADYYMEEMRHLGAEQIIIMLLDTKNHLLKDIVISKGTVNRSIISPREIFVEALKVEAVSVIMLHNHPSGDATPSKEDILLTRKLKLAGELIGIELIEHIIIGDNQYISMREKSII